MQLQNLPPLNLSLLAFHAAPSQSKPLLSLTPASPFANLAQAATSFECDGCNHHASFHSLENVAEDAVLQKWSAQEASNEAQSTGGANKKRRRIADKTTEVLEIMELPDDESDYEASAAVQTANTNRKRNGNGTRNKSTKTASAVK